MAHPAEVAGERRLWLAVIESGVKQRDSSYFYEGPFREHCALVGLDPDFLLRQLLAQGKIRPARRRRRGLT